MIEHQVQWTAPSFLWAETANATNPAVRQTINQPAILRFATDSFMDEFLTVLEKDPVQLGGLVAQPETWRGPTPAPRATALLEPTEPTSSLARKLNRLRLAVGRSGNTPASSVPAGQSSSVNRTWGRTGQARTLKLYQASHQRYYLLTACLVCGLTGLPDRRLEAGRQERATFVVRRLFPPGQPDVTAPLPPFDAATWEEFALVTSQGSSGWRKIPQMSGSTAAVLIPGEEQLPLFTANYVEDDGRRRRLLAGLVPVGKREAYMGAAPLISVATETPGQAPLPKTTRKIFFRSQVAEPWKSLIDRAAAVTKVLHEPAAPQPKLFEIDALLKAAREQIQTVSWYILVDFAQYLDQYVPNVWQAVLDPQQENNLTSTAEENLLAALKNTVVDQALVQALTKGTIVQDPSVADGIVLPSLYHPDDVKKSLHEALKAIVDWADRLEAATGSYNRRPTPPDKLDPTWPDFLFPFADPEMTAPQVPNGVPLLGESDEVDPEVPLEEGNGAARQAARASVDKLVALVVRALPKETTEPTPPLPLAAQPRVDTREGWFVMRCVFEQPNCGPLEPPVVSAPTKPFQLAGFFDPDAPARPIRIALPIDTSPAGLRKFDRNTAFMISDVLCGQIQRMKSLTFGDLVRSVLPWPFHKELSVPDTGPCTAQGNASLQLGMMLSLSIPIITICALILLIIIVYLLDIIFRWVPYFIMWFPLPGFKAKSPGAGT